MTLEPSRLELNDMLRGYKQRDFEQRYGSVIASDLDKVIYQDVGVVLYSIGNVVKAIKPDASVQDHRFAAGAITKRIVRAATSSYKCRRMKRYQFPPDISYLPFITSPVVFDGKTIADRNIMQLLSDTTSSMAARDAGIYLGILAARYIRCCPNTLFQAWVKTANMNPFWSWLFRTWTMEGALMMTIEF